MNNYHLFLNTLVPLLTLTTCILGFYSFWTIRRHKKKGHEYQTTIQRYSEQCSQLEKSLEDLSEQLSNTKIQCESKKTPHFTEFQSLIEKNVDTIERMTEAVEVSQYIAFKGKEVVHEMLMAVNEIHSSNEKIFQTIEKNNQKISEVVQVISAIDEKTKIINEIVFQTKLLSFNASLEAARAGENGKGFMVVAEEVGKLASMSGESAKEISLSLAENIEKVKLIVSESNRSIQEQVRVGKDKLEAGKITATESDIVLDEVVRNINKATNWINEITAANFEQQEFIRKVSSN